MHKYYKNARNIGQPKWHHQPFIQPMPHLKGYAILIPHFDPNMMVATFKVNFFKIP